MADASTVGRQKRHRPVGDSDMVGTQAHRPAEWPAATLTYHGSAILVRATFTIVPGRFGVVHEEPTGNPKRKGLVRPFRDRARTHGRERGLGPVGSNQRSNRSSDPRISRL